jgi:hypothetical protein
MEEYKGYNIVSAEGNESRFKRIKPVGKGSIYTDLLGLYTNAAEAKKAIDKVKSANAKKVDKNATKQTNG